MNPMAMMAQRPVNHVTSMHGAKLGDGFGDVAGRGGVYISFEWDQVRMRDGQRSRRLKLVKQPVGDPLTSSATYIKPEVAQMLYPAEWEFFTQHGDMPVSGTPLSELPGISRSQIQILNLSGLRSIEDVLSVGEEVINRIGYEAVHVRKVAKEWSKLADGNRGLIDYAAREMEMENRLNSERRLREQAEAQLRTMQARIEALEGLAQRGVMPAPAGAAMGSDGGEAIRRHDGLPEVEQMPNPLSSFDDSDFLSED